jgi:hypothetical protein
MLGSEHAGAKPRSTNLGTIDAQTQKVAQQYAQQQAYALQGQRQWGASQAQAQTPTQNPIHAYNSLSHTYTHTHTHTHKHTHSEGYVLSAPSHAGYASATALAKAHVAKARAKVAAVSTVAATLQPLKQRNRCIVAARRLRRLDLQATTAAAAGAAATTELPTGPSAQNQGGEEQEMNSFCSRNIC